MNLCCFKYDSALSFAGEDRGYVRQVAHILKGRGVKVFYDEFEEAVLWDRNLYTHLGNVYKEQARYTIIFCSQHYARKAWTTLERESAQDRALHENREYILPARFDDSKIPGLLDDVAYIDLRRHTDPQKFCDIVSNKLHIEFPLRKYC